MNTADIFCELLRVRLTLGQHDNPDLESIPAAYRCDELFLLAADLSDGLTLYAEGAVGDSVVREDALAVCAAAFNVFVATVSGGTDGRD